uniref:diacylglycerol O-acyltransferase n=1 Tax=Parascaris univalens TaxID=6257 RepID=A0A914ZJQ4_PARUN
MTRILGVEFAPLCIPIERRLQTLAMCYHLSFTFVSPILVIILPIYLAFTCFWPLIPIYAIWMFYDRNSPHCGGYSTKWFRRQIIHKYMANYFPVSLHKTAELPPNHNYLICSHPHGIISVGSYTNFCTNGTGVFEKFPSMEIRLCTLVGQFWTPLRREWGMLHGLVDCSKESLQYLLDVDRTTNNIVVLVIGEFIHF